ncbi:MAG: GAF domain-containing protein [Desulfobacter sp.]|nr:MAG: GAF domain-containing protein [Desulfobacter sp.]
MADGSSSTETRENRDDARTLAVLYEISHALSHTRNLKEFYARIHSALENILDAKNFYIALHHRERDSISFPYYEDEKDDMPEEIFNFSETASLTGRVIDAREPMIFYEGDIIEFARKRQLSVIGTVAKIWLGAPLIIKDRVIGAVAIQSFDSADAYGEADLSLLNIVARHIALAMERKDAEEKLKEQQRVLETILESSPVGICLVEDRNFTWVNTQMVRMLGYDTKSDLTNKNAAIIYASAQDYETVGGIIHSQLENKDRADFDYELVRRDGTRFRAHLVIAGADTAGGRDRQRTIVTIADLTQLETAREIRREKERLQGVLEMAGAVCHEINQPLQTLLGYTALFETPEDMPPKAMAQIKAQADRIGNITRRLSRITRYKTVSYPGDATIFDIWGSSSPKES